MWQKIQQKSCFKKQGKTPPERIFPSAESRSDTQALPSDSETVAGGMLSSGRSGRHDNSSEESGYAETRPSVIVLPLICLIKFYKAMISPIIPPCCRFTPTCSVYAITALNRHGIWYGGCLSFYRLLRCQPFCKGGFDPVPPKKITWQPLRHLRNKGKLSEI